MKAKISMVYWISAVIEHEMSYSKVCEIAKYFSMNELNRIYKHVKGAKYVLKERE